MALKGTEEFSILHPDVSKLFAYGDFEIPLDSALKLLQTLASLYQMPDSAELKALRETIQQVPRSEELKIKELVLSYDLHLDPDDSLSREGRIGKNLSLAILYLELERLGDALWALDATAQILVQPLLEGKEDFLQNPKLTDADVADTVIRLRRRLFLTSRRTVFSSSPPRDTRED